MTILKHTQALCISIGFAMGGVGWNFSFCNRSLQQYHFLSLYRQHANERHRFWKAICENKSEKKKKHVSKLSWFYKRTQPKHLAILSIQLQAICMAVIYSWFWGRGLGVIKTKKMAAVSDLCSVQRCYVGTLELLQRATEKGSSLPTSLKYRSTAVPPTF